MANVVTKASTVSCGHGAGKVTLTSEAKLKVGDDPVVLAISAAPVSGCTTVDNTQSGDLHCTTATATAGSAEKLKVGVQPVLLDTLSGTTTGTVASMPQTALAWKKPPTKLQAEGVHQ